MQVLSQSACVSFNCPGLRDLRLLDGVDEGAQAVDRVDGGQDLLEERGKSWGGEGRQGEEAGGFPSVVHHVEEGAVCWVTEHPERFSDHLNGQH